VRQKNAPSGVMTDTRSGKYILVSGATGRQGGAVLKHLLKNNLPVRALSRTPESLSSQRLISKNIQVVKGDMSDPVSLENAMRDCCSVYSIQNFFEYGADREILYGKNMADAAKKTGISHFVYSSVCNAGDHTGVPHFETKNLIEKHIQKIGLNATILRPVKFMENYYIPQVFRAILGGKLFDSIKAEKQHQMIAVDDIGFCVAETLIHPEKFIGRTIELAGDELSNKQIAVTMSRVLGKKIIFKRLPLFLARLMMDKEMYLMFKWFNEKGFTADMEAMKLYFPTLRPTLLSEWLENENWQRWNKKGTV
jgi:uncharacterized protein YbjT (DUF2867 family)